MNIALIFAGGTGMRMNSRTKPKQFLELHGKPIIIHTIEHFERHDDVDEIVVVCLNSWIDEFKKLLEQNRIKKVRQVISGGETAQRSVFNGLKTINESIAAEDNPIILIHDAVRPLIDNGLISDNIECVKKNGNAVTVTDVVETISFVNEHEEITNIADRGCLRMARAPQSFYLRDIIAAHEKVNAEKVGPFIDSASLMMYCGHKLYTVHGPVENTKVTTAADYYIFRALYEARENLQIFGLYGEM